MCGRPTDSDGCGRQGARQPRARLTSCLRHCENTNSEESAHERFVSNRITEPYKGEYLSDNITAAAAAAAAGV